MKVGWAKNDQKNLDTTPFKTLGLLWKVKLGWGIFAAPVKAGKQRFCVMAKVTVSRSWPGIERIPCYLFPIIPATWERGRFYLRCKGEHMNGLWCIFHAEAMSPVLLLLLSLLLLVKYRVWHRGKLFLMRNGREEWFGVIISLIFHEFSASLCPHWMLAPLKLLFKSAKE